MVGVAAAVVLVVYLQWSPSTTATQAPPEAPGIRPPVDEGERAVQSLTESLDFVKTVRGIPVFRLAAAQQVGFVDGWNEWSEPTLTVYGRGGGGGGRGDVLVVSDRMRTSGELADASEVRMMGNVRAELPGGGSFKARRLDYDVITGVVTGCNHNELDYAGMLVLSDCVYFQSAGDVTAGDAITPEVLRMWQDLKLRASGGENGLPEGLEGTAEEMRFRPGGELVTLAGEPRLEFDGTLVRGDELLLDIGAGAKQLSQVEAVGAARLRYFPGGASAGLDDRADAEPTDGNAVPARAERPSPAFHFLRGDRVLVEFGEGARVGVIRATSETADPARLTLAELGRLQADQIELDPGDQRQGVVARGAVAWESSAPGLGLRNLTTKVLRLRLAGDGLESVAADGEITAVLATRDGDEPKQFHGARLLLEWANGQVLSGSWPDGVTFNAAEKELSAGRADYDPETGGWVLGGTPRPVVSAPGLDLAADVLRVGNGGGVSAGGAVRGALGGDHLLAAAALFGGVPAVQLETEAVEIDNRGGLTIGSRVQVVWESQSLVANTLKISTEPGRLHASGAVELVAVGSGSEDDDGFVTVTANDLLVEQETAEIHVAGSAVLVQGRRRIAADKLTVTVDEAGAWRSILAQDDVKFRDQSGTASGESLVYELESGEILLRGSEDMPARFEYDGIEYTSTDALRVFFEDEQISIEATEAGRTVTNIVARKR